MVRSLDTPQSYLEQSPLPHKGRGGCVLEMWQRGTTVQIAYVVNSQNCCCRPQVVSGRRHIGLMGAEPVGNYGAALVPCSC